MKSQTDNLNLLSTALLISNINGDIIWANSSSEQLFATSLHRLQNLSVISLLMPIQKAQEKKGIIVDDSLLSTEQNKQKDSTFFLKEQSCYDQWVVGIHKPIQVDYTISSLSSKQAATFLSEQQLTTATNQQTFYLIELWKKDKQDSIIYNSYEDNQYKLARNMLRSIAHEIRNPLAGIRGATQLLQKLLKKSLPSASLDNTFYIDADNKTHTLDDETTDHRVTNKITSKVDTYTNIIISETDRLNQLVSQLLGTNKPPSFTNVNLHQSLEHVLTLAQSQYPNVNIKRDYDFSLPLVFADNDQLIQIFLNLINNSMQAMQEVFTRNNDTNGYLKSNNDNSTHQSYQAQLTVSTRVEFRKSINNANGNKFYKSIAKVTIHDNGDGIPAELIKQIFFPLVTGRANGTGLGLALVHNLIQKQNGAIDVTSEFGNTKFMLYLPFA